MYLRLTAIAALALCIACEAPIARAQQRLGQAQPAAKHFKLGALDLWALRDSTLIVPNDSSVFGLNANRAAVTNVLRAAGAPTDEITLPVDALLLRLPGHLILFDAGWGSEGHGVLPQSLASIGISPDEITDILITHSHSDHVGGLVDAQGRSTFSKARIRMSANEWAFMQTQDEMRALVSAIKTQIQTFEPGSPILPGVTPLALYGHTPGHVGYEIASQGSRLVDIGDLAHSSIISVVKPDWTVDYDNDKAQGARQRRRELQQLAAAHELIFAPHFPFPGLGRITQADDGFRFRPEVPPQQ
jgi:glyoxylase-like metal-dependent hydrolase (beta-lactamase superfamily II)